MAGNGSVLGLVGSPNREGRTYQMVASALEGASKAGAQVELVQLADHVVEACKDCLPWECMKTLKCQYEDPAFEYLSDRLLHCGAVVLGAPIYWWDTTGMVKYLILKMFRVYARSAPLAGLPALGIGIAGGTGNGLVSGLRPVYHFFQMLQMRALEPLPVTRFHWDAARGRAASARRPHHHCPAPDGRPRHPPRPGRGRCPGRAGRVPAGVSGDHPDVRGRRESLRGEAGIGRQTRPRTNPKRRHERGVDVHSAFV